MDESIREDAALPAAGAVALSAREARRIALAALGLARARPEAASKRHIGAMAERLGLVQIDSVNVLVRAHYVPGFSRFGSYDPALLDTAAYGGRRRLFFEYWGHEASLIRVDLQPSLRWRMERARAGEGIYGGLARFGRERLPYIESVLDEVRRRGGLTAREIGEGTRGTGSWWGWSEAKHALEWLFWGGLVTTATRRGGFERVYDLPERVLPRAVLDTPTPPAGDAIRRLVALAADALGIATARDLRSYFRLSPDQAAPAIAELVEEGRLLPATVEGWKQPAYLAAGAARPRRVRAAALVSPFDPLLWERDRVERLFGLRYRIEIYTPAEKREHGYYVLPFLFGDRIAARVDLKADRRGNRLAVLSAHGEPGIDRAAVAEALSGELRLMAMWLGLGGVAVEPNGDLAAALAP